MCPIYENEKLLKTSLWDCSLPCLFFKNTCQSNFLIIFLILSRVLFFNLLLQGKNLFLNLFELGKMILLLQRNGILKSLTKTEFYFLELCFSCANSLIAKTEKIINGSVEISIFKFLSIMPIKVIKQRRHPKLIMPI